MPDDRPKVIKLTERQMEILALVRKGFRNREIARRVGISDRTVKWHLKQLFALFEVRNRTGLAGTECKTILKVEEGTEDRR